MNEDMNLPKGMTCNQCAHWRRCSNLIDDLDGSETTCDWAPSRFRFVSKFISPNEGAINNEL